MHNRWTMTVLFALTVLGGAPVRAQSVRDLIVAGDKDYEARRAAGAVAYFHRALAMDSANYEALWKASRSEVDLAEPLQPGADQDSLLISAQHHAEAAIAVHAADVEGHFALARAMGRKALTVGTRERIKYSKIIRTEALLALKADSLHPGALHVLGMWNAEVMRVNGLSRAFAKAFLGAEIFSQASWEEAQRLLEQAVALDPTRIVHHLHLGEIYADRGNAAAARAQFEWIAAAPVHEYNDPLYKRQAAERLRKR